MVRHGRRFTTFAILWALLQLAVPTGLSFIDALLARDDDSRTAVTHVEETSSTGCRPVHSGECTICRDLSHLITVGPPPTTIAWIESERALPSVRESAGARPARTALPLSRAPPLA